MSASAKSKRSVRAFGRGGSAIALRRFHRIFLVWALLFPVACQEAASARAKNVLFVVFDTTRFDDWSVFASTGRASTTPVLEAIAKGGQRFTEARSLYAITVPAHVSMFTGREVAPARGRSETGYQEASLFTILADQGYRTFAFSGNANLTRETIEAMESVHVTDSDLGRRMPDDIERKILAEYGEFTGDRSRLRGPDRKALERNRRVIRANADGVNAAAIEAMREFASDPSRPPYFLFLNYNDAHDPYFPPPAWRDRFVEDAPTTFRGNLFDPRQRRAPVTFDGGREKRGLPLSLTAEGLSDADVARARELHRAELAFADARFGELLDALDSLGLMEDVAIVCVSDHGEAFGEEGRMSHGGVPIDALVHVPLVLSLPGVASQTIRTPVDHRDIKPTLLAYLGIEDTMSTGRDLLPMLLGEQAAEALPAARVGAEPDRSESNLIPGQSEEAREKLEERLKALGYLE